jgi:hypothetical protein
MLSPNRHHAVTRSLGPQWEVLCVLRVLCVTDPDVQKKRPGVSPAFIQIKGENHAPGCGTIRMYGFGAFHPSG